jgi:hypothetical protein
MKSFACYIENLSIGEEDSVDVEFTFHPAEYERGYLFCAEDWDITEVNWNETGELLTEDEFDKLEVVIIDAVKNHDIE